MILARFLTTKRVKIIALLLVLGGIFYGGWMIRGWYEGNLQKVLLERQARRFQQEIERISAQHRKDAEAALATSRTLESLRQRYDALQRGVQDVDVSEECRVVDPAALERMWNDARPEARPAGSAD